MGRYAQSVFLYTLGLKLLDAGMALGVWFLCWFIRFETPWFALPKGPAPFELYTLAAWPLVATVSLMLHTVGAYRGEIPLALLAGVKRAFQGAVLGSGLFVAALYFMGQVNYSRLYLGLFTALLIVGLILNRLLGAMLWQGVIRRRITPTRILTVGSGDLLDLYKARMDTRSAYPVEWVGHLATGQVEWLVEALNQHSPDQVVVAYPEEAGARYAPVLERLAQELVEVKVLPDFGKYSTFAYLAKHECGIPLLSFNQPPIRTSDRALKRVVDIVGSAAGLVILSPLLVCIAALVKWTSRGPVLFKQERVGADGVHFELLKFRTMHTDAENQTGPVWAVKNDPRTTALGKWLRKTSLDELPQLWNVLKGEMSLVGPRPERPEFVSQFKREIPKYMLRHKMKSGITGWAQVNGWRGNTSLVERIKHDLYYIGHWSHYLDFKILLLTPFKGLVHRHAY